MLDDHVFTQNQARDEFYAMITEAYSILQAPGCIKKSLPATRNISLVLLDQHEKPRTIEIKAGITHIWFLKGGKQLDPHRVMLTDEQARRQVELYVPLERTDQCEGQQRHMSVTKIRLLDGSVGASTYARPTRALAAYD